MKQSMIYLFTLFFAISALFSPEKITAQTGDAPDNKFTEISPRAGIESSMEGKQTLDWDLLLHFHTEAAEGGEQAVTTDGNFIYTASFAHNIIRKYDRTGTYMEQFTIPGVANIRDFAHDGEYFYASSGGDVIYQLDLAEEELISTITVEGIYEFGSRHLSFDPLANDGEGAFWVGEWDNLYLIDFDGNILEGPITDNINDIFGSAYDPWSEGGPYLWFFSQTQGSSDNPVHLTNIEQWDIENQSFTGAQQHTEDVPGYNEGNWTIAGGIFGTTELFDGKFALLGSIQQSPNLIFTYDVYHIAEAGSPGAVEDFTVTPGPQGALEAELSWTNPEVTVAGSVLDNIDNVVIYRDDELIHTITDTNPGDEVTYTDDSMAENDLYEYRIHAVNNEGEGWPTTMTKYIGFDAPAAPANIELSSTGTFGHITWDAPDTGINEGYLDTESVLYTLVRYPCEEEVVTGLEDTEYTDDSHLDPGPYHYEVTAYNNIGIGGSDMSNTAILAMGDVLLYETFDDPDDFPDGWFIQADVDGKSGDKGLGYDNWLINDNDFAGGEAPELRFSGLPRFLEGYSRLVTAPIDVQGYEVLEFRMKHYLNNLSTNDDGQAGLEYSTDGGDTWTVFWYHDAIDNIGPAEQSFTFTIPENTEEIHLGIRFSGDSRSIFTWNMDDMILRPPFEKDMRMESFSGPVMVMENEETSWDVTVSNQGQETQDDYHIRLMAVDEDDEIELASVAGPELETDEEGSVVIHWTPDENFTGLNNLYALVDLEGDQDQTNIKSGERMLFVFQEGIIPVTIGEGTSTTLPRLPLDFYVKNHLQQLFYYPEEFDLAIGTIESIALQSHFREPLENETVKIWMGTTEEENFNDLGGFIPAGQLTLVFEGEISIPEGSSVLYIDLDTTFDYTGGNLVMATNREFDDDNYTGHTQDKFIGERTPDLPARTRRAGSSFSPIDPYDPEGGSNTDWTVNTTFIFDKSNLGSLAGTITDDQSNTVEGVQVEIEEYELIVHSDADGHYAFPMLLEGDVTLNLSRTGYEDKTTTANIDAGETTTLDITMNLLPIVNVSGQVTGSDAPETGLEGALVSLEGYDDFEATTDSDGNFLLEDVYTDETYDLTITREGYEVYTTEIEVEFEHLDLGTIILDELATVMGVVVTMDDPDQAIEGASVSLSGVENYEATTDADGHFEIIDVRLNEFYDLTIDHPAYEIHADVVEVTTDPVVDLGDIEMMEVAFPPQNVTASETANGAMISWDAPDIPDNKGDKVLESYMIYRLMEGEEDSDSGEWTEVATDITAENYLDEGWEDVDQGLWLYAVKAEYSMDNISEPAFSNVLAKDMEVQVNISITTNSGDMPTGAFVTLLNQDDPDYEYTTTSPPGGSVTFNNVWAGPYTLMIELSGFETYVEENLDISEDMDIDVELIEHIVTPHSLSITTEGYDAGEALLSWEVEESAEFRYDDGVVDAQLGFQGTWNSVMGAVHHHDAELNEITWYLTEEGGPHNTVKVWVLGLDADGLPDRNNIVYTAEDVPNNDNEWNTYVFTETLEMPDGFFIGLSYNGFIGLAVDDGVGEPWDFVPGTQFGVFDINDPASEFTDIQDWDFEVNFLLRAYGVDHGEVDYDKMQQNTLVQGPAPELIRLEEPVVTNQVNSHKHNSKAFFGYTVYLNDQIVAEEVNDTEYLLTGLPEGDHTAGVQSVYTTGSSEIITIDFHVEDGVEDSFTVSFEVVDHENQPLDNAVVSFGEWQNDPGDYVFTGVTPGTYAYTVEKDGYDPVDGETQVTDHDLIIDVTMIPDDVSITDIDDVGITIYPNPSDGIFTVRADENIEQISITNLHGQIVKKLYTLDVSEKQIHASDLQPGVYMIQVNTAKGQITTRIVISH